MVSLWIFGDLLFVPVEEPPKKSASFVSKHWSPGPADTPRGNVRDFRQERLMNWNISFSISKESEIMIGI